jgi:putative ABC transport system permease protein
MGALLQDARYAIRALAKNPGFAAVAILTLALGIGANTAIFTVVNTVLLQPLPFPQPDRLVQLETSGPGGHSSVTSIPKYMVWRDQTRAFQYTALYDLGVGRMNLTGGDRPEQVNGIHVSADYFPLFGARIARGRTFTAAEDIPNGPRLAVISSALWQNRFGSDPDMIGKNIGIGGQPYEVIGILDRSFRWDPAMDVWLPMQADPDSTNQGNYLNAAARLQPGMTVAQAKAAMTLAAQAFRKKFTNGLGPQQTFTAESMQDAQVAEVRPALLLLFGTVAFVLLIACANVANLLLARAGVRRREIAIRSAMGAARKRIIGQLLTESVILSLAGGVLGLCLGYFGVRALLALNPGNIPRIGDKGGALALDWRVLLFTLAVSVFTGVLFGLIPAVHASRVDLNLMIKESGSRAGTGFRQNKARSILVVVEMALALVLLAGAALLIRTYIALRNVQPGFDRHNILTMNMELDAPQYQKTTGVAQLVRDGVERVESIPGVEAAATTCSLPLEPSFGLPFVVEGRPDSDSLAKGGGDWRSVSPNYFSVFRISILQGRAFTLSDSTGAAGVVIINEAMAKQFWPKGGALGARITIGKRVGPQFAEPPREIVGIVGDVRDDGLNNTPGPIMYIPAAQVTDGMTALNAEIFPIMWAIRTKVAPFSLSEDIQRELRDASGGLPAGHIRIMEQVVVESTQRQDFNTTLLAIFAGVALLLAAVGIYGLMAYSVQQRRPEIGIRMALGAEPARVRGMIVRQGMTLALIGVVVGVAAALALTRLMASLIFGVKTWDPVVFVSVTVVLAMVALLATYVPARRAARVDPLIALRYE